MFNQTENRRSNSLPLAGKEASRVSTRGVRIFRMSKTGTQPPRGLSSPSGGFRGERDNFGAGFERPWLCPEEIHSSELRAVSSTKSS